MSFMRYLSPTMDNLFIDSLDWVDRTYLNKHKSEDPSRLRDMYAPNLRMYSQHAETAKKKDPKQAIVAFLTRFGKKAMLSLGIYLLSFLPYVGRFVLPAASFYTFNKSVGWQPAVLIFGSSLFLPKRYIVMFLQSYFSSRSLMRELVNSIPGVNSRRRQLILSRSWSPTSLASAIPPSRRRPGSTTVKAYCMDLRLHSSSSSRSRFWVFSSTVLLKLQLPI